MAQLDENECADSKTTDANELSDSASESFQCSICEVFETTTTVYKCSNEECKNNEKRRDRIYCMECGIHVHKRMKHEFKPVETTYAQEMQAIVVVCFAYMYA